MRQTYLYSLEHTVRVRLLAPLLFLSLAAQGCFQTNCPDTKSRLRERFNPASPTFDPDLLSPAPLGQEGDIQAILETNPSRCVDLSDQFRTSAVSGLGKESCDTLGAVCGGADVCRRASASTDLDEVLECRQVCVDEDDTTCPTGTACIQVDDDQDGNITDDAFRCDNPNLGLCQGILRELEDPRCVECEELELLTCECRTGASGFACLAGIVDREQIIEDEAQVICGRAFPNPGQEDELLECINDITEPNTREERLTCTGININLPVLEDGRTLDCSRNSFQVESGVLCGNDQECFGGRCEFTSIDEFNGTTPLDPIETKVCSSDCGTDLNEDGILDPNPDRCELTFFCSDNIRALDGSLQAPGCMSIDNLNLGFSKNFDTLCDVADPDSCGVGNCQQTAGQNVALCTVPCTTDEQCGNDSSCVATNPANPDGFLFCSPRL